MAKQMREHFCRQCGRAFLAPAAATRAYVCKDSECRRAYKREYERAKRQGLTFSVSLCQQCGEPLPPSRRSQGKTTCCDECELIMNNSAKYGRLMGDYIARPPKKVTDRKRKVKKEKYL